MRFLVVAVAFAGCSASLEPERPFLTGPVAHRAPASPTPAFSPTPSLTPTPAPCERAARFETALQTAFAEARDPTLLCGAVSAVEPRAVEPPEEESVGFAPTPKPTVVAQFRRASELNPSSALHPVLERAVLLQDKGRCTGYLLDDGRSVLTAGHCFFENRCESLKLTVGGETHRCARVLRHPSQDLAVVEMDTRSSLPLKPTKVDQRGRAGTYVLLFGYVGGELMFSAVCRSTHFFDHGFYYECPTYPGMSGAAIFSVNPGDPDPYQLIGVHYGLHGPAHMGTRL